MQESALPSGPSPIPTQRKTNLGFLTASGYHSKHLSTQSVQQKLSLLDSFDPCLLPYQHLPSCREIASGQGVKVETTRYTLTEGIPTIPIRRTTSDSDTLPLTDAPNPIAAPDARSRNRSTPTHPPLLRVDTESTSQG